MKVTVVGNGYVGTVTATSFAWLGNEIVGLEDSWLRAEQLAAGELPFYEPGLSELLTETLATGRLTFTANAEVALRETDVVFLCVGTPPGKDGLPDLRQLQQAAETLRPYLRNGLVVVNKSTVPPGSGDMVRSILAGSGSGASVEFSVMSNPEFLREGSAIENFLSPDRIVLGGDQMGIERLTELYRPILEQSFPGAEPTRRPSLFTMDLVSAEIAKYAANAFLATKISFANEVANLCELTGADVRQVLPAVGADGRIGPSFLGAGLGWGGSCFPKDIAALMAIGRDGGYGSPILSAAVEVNEARRESIVARLDAELGGLQGKRIALLGLAFKAGTDDLREAPSLDLARRLIGRGATVAAWDPVVKQLPADVGAVRVAPDGYEAADGADAVIVVTEWPEFAKLDFSVLAGRMRGSLVLDGRNHLDPTALAEAGLRLVGVGWGR
jgi:UDPglucose 6-dehydrogenase